MVNEPNIEKVDREKINELYNDLMFFVAGVKKIDDITKELKILTGAAQVKLGGVKQYAFFSTKRIEDMKKELLDIEVIVNKLSSKKWPRQGEIEAVVKDLKKII